MARNVRGYNRKSHKHDFSAVCWGVEGYIVADVYSHVLERTTSPGQQQRDSKL